MCTPYQAAAAAGVVMGGVFRRSHDASYLTAHLFPCCCASLLPAGFPRLSQLCSLNPVDML